MRSIRHLPAAALPALAAVAALLVGCRDAAGPTEQASLASGSGSAGSGTLSFWVYPNNPATFNLGDHKITFDKNAICDVASSSYGATEWDKPCTVAAGGVKITATWSTDSRGHPVIDFQPAMRFNPASNVTLFVMDKDAAADPNYRIFWRSPSGAAVDEGATDASVATQVGSNGYLFRRVKHFSGYIVTTRALDTSISVELLRPHGAEETVEKSGHVVATGVATPELQ